mmetsp:Transcript_23972/g.80866  ORF Transcript_23972/g.80866 Transcript_23972/m.80866 type:complete len:246 (-) Transcript_23972:505-1242(-)
MAAAASSEPRRNLGQARRPGAAADSPRRAPQAPGRNASRGRGIARRGGRRGPVVVGLSHVRRDDGGAPRRGHVFAEARARRHAPHTARAAARAAAARGRFCPAAFERLCGFAGAGAADCGCSGDVGRTRSHPRFCPCRTHRRRLAQENRARQGARRDAAAAARSPRRRRGAAAGRSQADAAAKAAVAGGAGGRLARRSRESVHRGKPRRGLFPGQTHRRRLRRRRAGAPGLRGSGGFGPCFIRAG